MPLDQTARTPFTKVGTRPLRPDGVDKVTGRARFGADMNAPGMLIGQILRSPHAHARIRSIDSSAAEALPGVKAVVTRDDFADRNDEFRDVLVNINFPDCAPDEVKGIAITMQGKRDQDLLRIDARHDGRGNPYYWLAFARRERRNLGAGTDLAAIAENRIAVTPLRLNLTDEPFMTRLAEELDEAPRRK